MKLRDYQEEAREAVQAEWEKGNKRTLLVLPTGCHAIGEKLLLADGKIKAVEDITENDKLIGSDGLARNILHIQTGEKTLYKITPRKGESFIVTSDHKLTLVRTNEKSRNIYPSDKLGGQIIDVTVAEWLSWSKNKKHIYKLLRSEAIERFENSDEGKVTIDPYFLGVLLGDGEIKNSI